MSFAFFFTESIKLSLKFNLSNINFFGPKYSSYNSNLKIIFLDDDK